MSAPLAILDTSTAKLQVKLAGAVATSECPMTAQVIDIKDPVGRGASAEIPRSYNSITTGNTAVDLVPVPPTGVRRKIIGFSLYNDDTTAVTVTVQLYVSSTVTRILWYGALQSDENLYYSEDRGWYATDANANQKSNASSTSGATSEALSAATSAATRASTADSKALSVSTLTSTADSKALSVSTNTSVADSKALSVSTLTSTADSKAVSAGTSASIARSAITSGNV